MTWTGHATAEIDVPEEILGGSSAILGDLFAFFYDFYWNVTYARGVLAFVFKGFSTIRDNFFARWQNNGLHAHAGRAHQQVQAIGNLKGGGWLFQLSHSADTVDWTVSVATAKNE